MTEPLLLQRKTGQVHSDPPKAETIIVLQGSVGYLTFYEDGKISEALTLSGRDRKFGVDSEPGVYHTFFALEQDTVLFEVKPGPLPEKFG